MYTGNHSLCFLQGYLGDIWIFENCTKNTESWIRRTDINIRRMKTKQIRNQNQKGAKEEYKITFILSDKNFKQLDGRPNVKY